MKAGKAKQEQKSVGERRLQAAACGFVDACPVPGWRFGHG